MTADSLTLCGEACPRCGDDLDPSLWESSGGPGVHATCRRPIGPVVPDLATILLRHYRALPRSTQTTIGPSQVGDPCDRAIGYRLANVPPVSDEGLKWAPLLGTWTHAGIARALHEENERLGRERYLIERRIAIDPPLVPSGETDVYDMDTDEVIDWKLVSAKSIKEKRRSGSPGRLYRIQAQSYALGWSRAGFDVQSVRVVFLPKSSISIHDAYEWSEPFDPELAEQALARVRRIDRLMKALGVEADPSAWALLPGAPERDNCSWCPWLRQTSIYSDDRNPADATGCPGAPV